MEFCKLAEKGWECLAKHSQSTCAIYVHPLPEKTKPWKSIDYQGLLWPQEDSNPQPSEPKSDILSSWTMEPFAAQI